MRIVVPRDNGVPGLNAVLLVLLLFAHLWMSCWSSERGIVSWLVSRGYGRDRSKACHFRAVDAVIIYMLPSMGDRQQCAALPLQACDTLKTLFMACFEHLSALRL